MEAGRREYNRGSTSLHFSPSKNGRRSSGCRNSPSSSTGRSPLYSSRQRKSKSRSPLTRRRRDDRPNYRERSRSRERSVTRKYECDESTLRPRFRGPDNFNTLTEAVNDTRIVVVRKILPDAEKRSQMKNGHPADQNYGVSGSKEDGKTTETVERIVRFRTAMSSPQKYGESSAASSSYQNGRRDRSRSISDRNGSYDDDKNRYAKRESEYANSKNNIRYDRANRQAKNSDRERRREKTSRRRSSPDRSSQQTDKYRRTSFSRDQNSRNARKSSDKSSLTDKRRNEASSSNSKRCGKYKNDISTNNGGKDAKERENCREKLYNQNEQTETADDNAENGDDETEVEMCQPMTSHLPSIMIPSHHAPVILQPGPLVRLRRMRPPIYAHPRAVYSVPHPPPPPFMRIRMPGYPTPMPPMPPMPRFYPPPLHPHVIPQ